MVLGLAIRNFVDAEPFVRGSEQAGKMPLDVLNVVELRCQGVFSVDDNDFPVCLFFVEQRHHTQDLNLLDLTCVADKLSDFAHVERVIVAFGLGLGMDNIGIFPCLERLSSGYECDE